MAWRTTKRPMTNKQAKCECGSGYMPTIMEQSRNRWACLECYQKPLKPSPMPDHLMFPNQA